MCISIVIKLINVNYVTEYNSCVNKIGCNFMFQNYWLKSILSCSLLYCQQLYIHHRFITHIRHRCNMIMYRSIIFLFFIITSISNKYVIAENDEDISTELYIIEGKVFPWENGASNGWQLMTHVMANGGEHYGFLREDGTFIISNVPSGSYIIEVVNPNYVYEPVRVEINSKGKFRARKVNLIQTSQVIQVPYPLKMRPVTPFRYFQVREQWRVTDFLFNPMVLMMILPFLLIMVIPKIMNDPETRKEMEQLNNFTNYNIPEMSEVITSYLSGGEKQKSKAVKAAKKRQ